MLMERDRVRDGGTEGARFVNRNSQVKRPIKQTTLDQCWVLENPQKDREPHWEKQNHFEKE
jgi:hypothetical protein